MMKGIIVASNDIIDNKKTILCSAFAFSDLRFICNIIQNKNKIVNLFYVFNQ